MSIKKSSPSFDTEVTRAWCNTQTKVIKIRYEWTIDHFSLTYKKIGDKYNSSTFYANNYDQLKWFLQLKPNGSDADSKGYVSLYLHLKPCELLKVVVLCKASLLNDKGEEACKSKMYRLFKNDNVGYGWPKFVDRNFLLDTSNGLLPKNKLTILCEINFVSDISNVSGQSSSVPVKMFELKLGDDFVTLIDNTKFSDVTLVSSGHEFKAHKAILAARSDVFAAMFEHNFEEANTNRVVIADIDHEVLKEMLHFIYTNETPNLEKMAKDLLVAADKYNIKKLKGMCEKSLYVNLSIETAVETLIFAGQYNADNLKARTKAFMVIHIKDVVETQSWKEFVQKSPSKIACNSILVSIVKNINK